MFVFGIFILSTFFSFTYPTPIWDGALIDISKLPFAVQLDVTTDTESGGHECTGVIYNKNIIITAAHCLFESGQKLLKVTLNAGNSDQTKPGQRIAKLKDPKMFIVHPNYHEKLNKNDIAIIKLPNPGLNVQNPNIKLATISNENVKIGDIVSFFGWGVTNSGRNDELLRRGKGEIVKTNKCDLRDMKAKGICIKVIEGYPCSGDSGGPIVNSRNEIIGITSYIISEESQPEIQKKKPREQQIKEENCAARYFHGTEVKLFIKWIESN